jgi:hypothetical protein
LYVSCLFFQSDLPVVILGVWGSGQVGGNGNGSA